jgi:hypothetical protein
MWSGLDVFGKLLLQKQIPTYEEPIEFYAFYFYTSFTTDMYNVFNQAIPAWLATLFVLNFWRQLQVLPLIVLVAYSPFPFIGLTVVYAAYYLSRNYTAGQSGWGLIRQATTNLVKADNLAVLIAVLVPYALFYGSHAGHVPSAFVWTRYFDGNLVENVKKAIVYFATYFLEVGVFAGLILLISPDTYRTRIQLFWICTIVLLIVPVWSVGLYNDFASRGSIPALTVLCVLTIKALIDWYSRRPVGYRLVVPLLLMGFTWIAPIRGILRGIPFSGAPELREALVTFSDPAITSNNDPQGIYQNLGFYYTYEPKKHFFYRHLARR